MIHAESALQSGKHMMPGGSGRARDVRRRAVVIVLVAVAAVGGVVALLPSSGVDGNAPREAESVRQKPLFEELKAEAAARDIGVHAELPQADEKRAGGTPVEPKTEAERMLAEGEQLIEAGRFKAAERRIDEAGRLDPDNPRAYVLMGRSLLGQQAYGDARFYFERAIDLDPTHAEAYFGFAAASEGLGDLESALGGMRGFLHMVKNPDPYRLQVAQARSAIWEWEAQLGRGPWGPTKGVPPGFTAEEIRRDGKGVGTKMQKADTLRPDGTMDFEIKSGDRFPELWRK